MADVEQIRRAGLDTQRTADQAVLGVGSNTEDIIEKGDPVFQIVSFFFAIVAQTLAAPLLL